MSIYKGTTKIAGTAAVAAISVDTQLLPDSTNPVENRAVADAFGIFWQKPSDWPELRSGALQNNIYLLVAHSADFTTYPTSSFYVRTTSGTCDVFIDGIKYITTSSSAEEVNINWATLNLSSGYQISYPSALQTHIIRICPTDNTKKIDWFYWGKADHSSYPPGLLWAHYCIDYKISLTNAFGSTSRGCETLEAVTAYNNALKVSSVAQAFARCKSLKTIPILDCDNASIAAPYVLYNLNSYHLKRLHFRNLKQSGAVANSEMINNANGLQEIILENSTLCWYWGTFGNRGAYSLKRIPDGTYMHPTTGFTAEELSSLEPTVLDFSSKTTFPYLSIGGTAAHPVRGLKGLTVSNQAAFNDNSSPQINVSYTGLNRAALVNLFNSLPTVSASQVINITGATGANDLDATDLAIATGKGWTVTR